MTETLTTTAGTPMKHVAMASYVGSAIEYYDFYIYGTAAALVFPRVFFPHLGTTMATVASMATFAAAFISRPAGAAFFGHFGDRLGRKTTLTATLLIMGLSTVAVGVVPGAVTIGVAAPLILLALRLAQGFASAASGPAPLCWLPSTHRRLAWPLRHVHPNGRRQRPRLQQPGVPGRQRNDRRNQPGIHGLGVGDCRSCSARTGRHRPCTCG